MDQQVLPQPGQRYWHFRNDQQFYTVIGIAKHSETEELMVIYRAEYAGEFPYGQLWARPLSIFTQRVLHNGVEVPRFQVVEV